MGSITEWLLAGHSATAPVIVLSSEHRRRNDIGANLWLSGERILTLLKALLKLVLLELLDPDS